MRYTFLFLILFTCEVYAYDVVLKDGTVISGTIIRATEERVILKESTGSFRSVNKNEVDLEKTKTVNGGKAFDEEKVDKNKATDLTAEDGKKESESPVNARKSNAGKVFTNDDIRSMSNFTEPGTVQPADTNTKNVERVSEKKWTEKEEQKWRDQAESLKNHITKLEKDSEKAEKECELAGGPSAKESIFDPKSQRYLWVDNTICKRAESIKEELTKTEESLFRFRQKAGLAGVPEDWVQ